MAAGVSALLSPRFDVTATVSDSVELLRSLETDERVLDVRYAIIPDELQRVWGSRSRGAVTVGAPEHR